MIVVIDIGHEDSKTERSAKFFLSRIKISCRFLLCVTLSLGVLVAININPACNFKFYTFDFRHAFFTATI